jgi:hypothetical protein
MVFSKTILPPSSTLLPSSPPAAPSYPSSSSPPPPSFSNKFLKSFKAGKELQGQQNPVVSHFVEFHEEIERRGVGYYRSLSPMKKKGEGEEGSLGKICMREENAGIEGEKKGKKVRVGKDNKENEGEFLASKNILNSSVRSTI